MLERMPLLAAILLTCCLLWPLPALAQPDAAGMERLGPTGHIDWILKKAVATGVGLPPPGESEPARRRLFARRAALLDARRNLLETIHQVRVEDGVTVASVARRVDVVRTQVAGMVQGAVIEMETDLPDGGAQVVLGLDLARAGLLHLLPTKAPVRQGEGEAAGEIRGAVGNPVSPPSWRDPPASPELPAIPASPAVSGAPPAVSGASPAVSGAPGATTPPRRCSSLVVDARGAGFLPSLSPTLHLGERQIYPGPDLDPAVLANLLDHGGLAPFYRTVDQARRSDRAGDAPCLATAHGVLAGRGDALVLEPQDQALLEGPGRQALASGAVVIVF